MNSQTVKSILLSLAAVFTPIKGALVTVFILVIADLITGVLAARHKGKKITSSGLRRTLSKLCVFETVLMLGFLCQSNLTGELFPIINIISAFIGITEFKSVAENLNVISGGNLLSSILVKLNKKEE